jgi:hypothetical protein
LESKRWPTQGREKLEHPYGTILAELAVRHFVRTLRKSAPIRLAARAGHETTHSVRILASPQARAANQGAERTLPPARLFPADVQAAHRGRDAAPAPKERCSREWGRLMSRRLGSGSRFAEPRSSNNFAPPGTGTPPMSTYWVVCRRQAMTEVSRRSTSSIATGINFGSWQIASQESRWASSLRKTFPRRPVVVS